MVSRSTRYQGQDVYERASSNAALAEQVGEELAEMYYSTPDDQQMEEGSIASLMGRSCEEESAEISPEAVGRAETPAAEALSAQSPPAEAVPAAKPELSFLEKMVMNMRSMFS